MHKQRFSLQNPNIFNIFNNNNNNNKPSFSTTNSIKRKNACPKGSYSPTLKNENGDFICDDAAQEMFKYESKFDKLTRKNSSFPKFSLCCDKESFYSSQNQSKGRLKIKSIREQLRRQAQEEENRILEKEAKDEKRHSRLSSLRPSTSRTHTIEKIITGKRKRASKNSLNGIITKKIDSSISNKTKISVKPDKPTKPKKNVKFNKTANKSTYVPTTLIRKRRHNEPLNTNTENMMGMDISNINEWGDDPNEIFGLLSQVNPVNQPVNQPTKKPKKK